LVAIDHKEMNGITIQNANFHWGLKHEAVEEKHSKVIKARKSKNRDFSVLEESTREH
jgi:hypothetical protein